LALANASIACKPAFMADPARESTATANDAASAAPTRPCPACGAEWPDEIRYCGECGGRMPDATLVAAPYKVQVEATDVALPAGENELSEEFVPTLVPERAQALFNEPEPHTLAAVSTLDTGIVVDAWKIVAPRLGPFAVGTLVVSLASSALSSTVIGLVAMGGIQGGHVIAGLRAASGRSVSVNDFFDGYASFDLAKRLSLTWLLTTLMVSLGFIVLVVPGLYLMMATAYAPLLVVDRGMKPWEAVRMSIEHVNARLDTHCAIFACVLALVVGGSLACGLGLLVALPIAFVTLALCYQRVFGIRDGVDHLG
jgi:hypothetical protein